MYVSKRSRTYADIVAFWVNIRTDRSFCGNVDKDTLAAC